MLVFINMISLKLMYQIRKYFFNIWLFLSVDQRTKSLKMTTLFLLSQPYPENLFYIDDPWKIQEKGDLTNAYFPYKIVNIIYKSVLL